ncbi:MAG: glycoside hydrolase 43 family protein [Prevotellaceae bacterium]|jgi:beta-xylosidase|nr:glycoside hydrolase 43 family protein [Prevotellaceae bacterium]
MMYKKISLLLLFAGMSLSLSAQRYVSEVWLPDSGNGYYKNPILHADYSDPDVCRAGDDYYMTASSFNCIPGLPILHSKDLVGWQLVGHAVACGLPQEAYNRPRHGDGVWAPSIRLHNGELYIFFGDPDYGIYMTKAAKAEGPWTPLALVKEGKGLIDPCPLWDDDGSIYLVHAYAGSRAGIKSLLALCRLSPDATKAVTEDIVIFDGHDADETIEGPKFYKRNGYYYIFAPAGGVATGWQLALRSKSVFGPYERKVVLAQGKSAVNGPHQGAWVDSKSGEDWFFHFQEIPAAGRVVHLQPMRWVNGWPVIGEDEDGDGCGNPVAAYRKPNVGATYPAATPAESDEFNGNRLGLQWQWHATPRPWWAFLNRDRKQLRLFSVPLPDSAGNLWEAGNLLLQKFPAPDFKATVKLKLTPNSRLNGERAGLLVMGADYAAAYIEKTPNGFVLAQSDCAKADRRTPERVNATVKLPDGEVFLRVQVNGNRLCTFAYSRDGVKYAPLGQEFTAQSGRWIGAKVGLFCQRPKPFNDGGWADVEYFRVSR